jgi:DNA-binding GntR family transcriptional regulator
MVDAIARRDAVRADALAHAHTELFRDRFLQYLKHNLAADIGIRGAEEEGTG